MNRQVLLTNYFAVLYQLGVCIISHKIANRFASVLKQKKRRRFFLPFQTFQLVSFSLLHYLVDISTNLNSIAIISNLGLRQNFVFTEQITDFFGNYFVSGVGARFGNFLNWADNITAQKSRASPYVWDSHYLPKSINDKVVREIGAIILHKYFYKALTRTPQIILHSEVARKDFFFPLSKLVTRFQTFFVLFTLLKIHYFYRNKLVADRIFWNSTFGMYYREYMLDTHSSPFGYIFRLFGRQHTSMQTWEYASLEDVFKHADQTHFLAEKLENKYD